MDATRLDALADALRRAQASFRPEARLPHDPLGIVREYEPEDREVVAHVCALLAYGAVAQLRAAAREVLEVLGPSPRLALESWRPGTFERARPDFVYRMTRAADVEALLTALAAAIARDGTLERTFARAAGACRDDGDSTGPLAAYVAEIRRLGGSERRGFHFLTPDPATGSAAKRWHLLLRWLVRPNDGVDLGAWKVLQPRQLLLPLDTHIVRHVWALGLSARRTADYRMTREATDVLLQIDPIDPLQFDMALCHMGIAGDCHHRWVPEVCGRCGLRPVCVLAAGPSGPQA